MVIREIGRARTLARLGRLSGSACSVLKTVVNPAVAVQLEDGITRTPGSPVSRSNAREGHVRAVP